MIRLVFIDIDDHEIIHTISTTEQFLNYNKRLLVKIPDSIGNLTQLTELDLSRNSLTDLPDSIGGLAINPS